MISIINEKKISKVFVDGIYLFNYCKVKIFVKVSSILKLSLYKSKVENSNAKNIDF